MDLLTQLQKYTSYIVLIPLLLALIYKYLYGRLTRKRKGNEEYFVKRKEKLLVFKPQPDLKNLDPCYGYFHLKGYDEWNFDKKDMERRFESIKGLCKECEKNPTEVGFYEEGYMKGFPDHNEWVIPSKPPLPLCKQCAFGKIRIYFENPNGRFSERTAEVYGGDGIYISTTTEK